MEKLSSILPASPRVQSVDLQEAAPVRPGAPTFGRPVGVSTVKDRFSVSQQAKDIAFKDTLASVNPKEAKGVKVVDDMTKKFFETRLNKPEVAGSEATQARQVDVMETLPQTVGPVKMEAPATTQQATSAKEPTRRLDVEA